MATLAIDELNTPKEYTVRSIPYEKYFGEMELSDKQIKQRIEFAKKFEDGLLAFLTLFTLASAYGQDNGFLRIQLQQMYFEITTQFLETDKYISNHAEEFADNFIESTNKHISDPWYTSEDRAKFNAENEANDILNYSDFQDAIADGKNVKEWRTLLDNRVRPTHKEVHGKTIPIGDTFEVGGTLLRFPGDSEFDTSNGEETCGCRCSLKYSYNPRYPKYTAQEESE